MTGWRLPLVGALALTMGLSPMGAATAAPMTMPAGAAKASAGSAVIEVGHRHHRHHHHHHHGSGLAIGLGIGVIGGLLAAEAYRSRGYGYDGEDPRELCARDFRSFEWNTGMYTTYEGERRLCPYLR